MKINKFEIKFVNGKIILTYFGEKLIIGNLNNSKEKIDKKLLIPYFDYIKNLCIVEAYDENKNIINLKKRKLNYLKLYNLILKLKEKYGENKISGNKILKIKKSIYEFLK